MGEPGQVDYKKGIHRDWWPLAEKIHRQYDNQIQTSVGWGVKTEEGETVNRDNFLWHLGFRMREYWETELKGNFLLLFFGFCLLFLKGMFFRSDKEIWRRRG